MSISPASVPPAPALKERLQRVLRLAFGTWGTGRARARSLCKGRRGHKAEPCDSSDSGRKVAVLKRTITLAKTAKTKGAGRLTERHTTHSSPWATASNRCVAEQFVTTSCSEVGMEGGREIGSGDDGIDGGVWDE